MLTVAHVKSNHSGYFFVNNAKAKVKIIGNVRRDKYIITQEFTDYPAFARGAPAKFEYKIWGIYTDGEGYSIRFLTKFSDKQRAISEIAGNVLAEIYEINRLTRKDA